jgi:hypothetical protein
MCPSTTERVPCMQCGRPVRVTTAQRTNGLCVRCSMEHVRRRPSPFSVLYTKLMDRVHNSPSGFDGLSETEKVYYAVALLRNEVNNGGFHQYFFNSSGSYYAYAEKGLVALGATQILELLRKAKAILFPDVPVPVETKRRREILPVIASSAARPDWNRQLGELDKHFYADNNGLTPRLEAFARSEGLVSAEPDSA